MGPLPRGQALVTALRDGQFPEMAIGAKGSPGERFSRSAATTPRREFGAWACLCHVLRKDLPPINKTARQPGTGWVPIGARLITPEGQEDDRHCLDACRVILGLDTLYAGDPRIRPSRAASAGPRRRKA